MRRLCIDCIFAPSTVYQNMLFRFDYSLIEAFGTGKLKGTVLKFYFCKTNEYYHRTALVTDLNSSRYCIERKGKGVQSCSGIRCTYGVPNKSRQIIADNFHANWEGSMVERQTVVLQNRVQIRHLHSRLPIFWWVATWYGTWLRADLCEGRQRRKL